MRIPGNIVRIEILPVYLDRFDLVRRAAFEAAFPITGTGVLLLDDRRVSKLHRQLRRGWLGIPL